MAAVAEVMEGELVAGFSGELLRHLGQFMCVQEQRWEMSLRLVLTRGVVEEQEDEELEPQT